MGPNLGNPALRRRSPAVQEPTPDIIDKNASYRDQPDDYGVWEIPGLLGILPDDRKASFSIIEYGCGYGHSAAEVKRQYPNARVVAADLMAECLERTGSSYPDLETLLIDADKPLPIGAGEFDFAFSSNLFEHLHDDGTHLRETHRILRRGGQYAISTPNMLIELIYWGLIRPEQKTRWRSITARLLHDRSIQHSNLQTVWSLKKTLRAHGFEPEVRKRGKLSNTELRKLSELLAFFPGSGPDIALDVAHRAWASLPEWLGPSIVVVGTKL
jgi:SAM-dependent methyltransferase